MTTQVSAFDATKPCSSTPHITLWAAQAILAALFGMAGAMKTTMPIAELAKTLPCTAAFLFHVS
jgi:hypothetical protein